jgi:hypothetical protein
MPHGTWSRAGFAQTIARADLSLQQLSEQLRVPLSTVEGWLAGTAPEQHHLADLQTVLDKRMGGEVSANPALLFDAPEPPEHPRVGGMSMKEFLENGWKDRLDREDEAEAIRGRIAQLQRDRSMPPRGSDSYAGQQHRRRIDRQIAAERERLGKVQAELAELKQQP